MRTSTKKFGETKTVFLSPNAHTIQKMSCTKRETPCDDDDEKPFTPAFAGTLREWTETETETETKRNCDARIQRELARVQKCLVAKAKEGSPTFSVFTVDNKIDHILLDAVCDHYKPLGWDVHPGKEEGLLEYMYTCYWFSERK